MIYFLSIVGAIFDFAQLEKFISRVIFNDSNPNPLDSLGFAIKNRKLLERKLFYRNSFS